MAPAGAIGLGIERRCCVPEDPLIYKTSREIPDRGGDEACGSGHAVHLQERPPGVGHKIERQ